ncbi:GNAT family N-acetyltransferase [Salinactinospora qingdaonensis]|uniref:GNAT family N-acetyltransferase n=2 Tax=Salinactinospora qingdaonensis TaxID=702744 RepID=A0ABP7EV40_9ACTN
MLLPVVILETDRLTLRAFTEADIDPLHQAATDPLTQRWIPLPRPGVAYTRADAEEWCTTGAPSARVSGDGQQWAAIESDTGLFVGSFGLNRTLWTSRITEIGYWVAPWARGNGYAPEAVVAITRWVIVEQRFERVELKAATANTGSRRVAAKAGFTYEGIERNAMRLHAGRSDLAVYSVIPADLDPPRHQRDLPIP